MYVYLDKPGGTVRFVFFDCSSASNPSDRVLLITWLTDNSIICCTIGHAFWSATLEIHMGLFSLPSSSPHRPRTTIHRPATFRRFLVTLQHWDVSARMRRPGGQLCHLYWHCGGVQVFRSVLGLSLYWTIPHITLYMTWSAIEPHSARDWFSHNAPHLFPLRINLSIHCSHLLLLLVVVVVVVVVLEHNNFSKGIKYSEFVKLLTIKSLWKGKVQNFVLFTTVVLIEFDIGSSTPTWPWSGLRWLLWIMDG